MLSHSPPAGVFRRPWSFDHAEARHLLRISMPITAIALVNMAMSVTDTLMAAALGQGALAAVAVSSDFYSLLFYLVAGTIGGIAPLYAAASAAGDETRLRALRSAGWLVALGAGAVAAPLVWLAPEILRPLGVTPGLLEDGRGYCQVMALTLLPNAVAALYRARLTALERPGVMLRITVAAVPLNALGNWLMMFGPGSLPALGTTGAALSSLLIWTGIAAALALMARRHGDSGSGARPRRADVAEILGVGLPIGIATLADIGLFLGATIYAGTFSVDQAAAHALAIRLAGVSYTLSVGLNQAVMVRVARSDLAGPRQTTIASALALAGAFGLLLAALLGGAAVAVGQAGPALLGQVAILAAPAIALLAVMEVFGPLSAVADGVLRGRRDTRSAMAFVLVGNWLIAAPVALLLTQVFPLGVAGLWAGLLLGVISTALMMLGRLRRHWSDFERSSILGG